MSKRIDMDNEKNKDLYYALHTVCNNCGHQEEICIPKGHTVGDVICPNCRCARLRRM